MGETETLSYTLFFDIFKPNQLIGEASVNTHSKATEYLSVLKEKKLLNYPQDSILEPWANKVFNNSDIFASVPSSSSPFPSDSNILSLLHSHSSTQSKLIEKKLEDLQISEIRRNKIDYRFSKIEVTYIDMNISLKDTNEPLKAKVLGYGVIRLYRDKEPQTNGELGNVEGSDTMVAILGVPFYFTASDLLLGFFDKDTKEAVSHFRLVRSQTPNRFIVLMKFRSAQRAKTFVEQYNGKPFNSMEPEACNAIYIKRIVFRPASGHSTINSIPYLLEDPFTYCTDTDLKVPSGPSQQKKLHDKSKYTELATCPVCLERLDSTVTGLLTIPCQHTFHCDCLSRNVLNVVVILTYGFV
ncbi:unnamed protein product [Ambrosiozyma monospora]|uniref:Unnamed protein product n=1 Tax=Ambrosiozyma monospora TaxID=43982 RepID=A0A9W6Z2Q1_AMBMO|nr:unnamed protein product [Ambrosiozyma monospora]